MGLRHLLTLQIRAQKVLERQQWGGNTSGFFSGPLLHEDAACRSWHGKIGFVPNEALRSACSMAKVPVHTTVTSCSNVPMMSSLFIVSCGLEAIQSCEPASAALSLCCSLRPLPHLLKPDQPTTSATNMSPLRQPCPWTPICLQLKFSFLRELQAAIPRRKRGRQG